MTIFLLSISVSSPGAKIQKALCAGTFDEDDDDEVGWKTVVAAAQSNANNSNTHLSFAF